MTFDPMDENPAEYIIFIVYYMIFYNFFSRLWLWKYILLNAAFPKYHKRGCKFVIEMINKSYFMRFFKII